MVYKAEDEALLKSALLMLQEKQLSSLPQGEKLDEIVFSENFENKMQKLINSQKKPYYIIINTVGKRVACIIVAVLISFTAMMSVDAIREPFIRYIVETYEKYSSIYFITEEKAGDDKKFKIHLPSYIPNGYEKNIQEEYSNYCYVEFINETGNIFTIQQRLVDKNDLLVDTEGVTVEKEQVNGIEAIYYKKDNEHNLIFSNNKYCFIICGNINKNELMNIAESINFDIN